MKDVRIFSWNQRNQIQLIRIKAKGMIAFQANTVLKVKQVVTLGASI